MLEVKLIDKMHTNLPVIGIILRFLQHVGEKHFRLTIAY
jgi:hypothetical protein